MRLIVAIVTLAALLAGCRAATPEGAAPSDGPPTALAARPGTLPSTSESSGEPSGSARPSGSVDPADPSVGPTPGSSTSGFRSIGRLADRKGDAGAQTPGYADLLDITIAEDGHSMRARVRVAATIPDPAPRGEQIAIGVDLYRAKTTESDYQLYAQGTVDGWFAYLATPEGVVDYPGTFAIGGDTMVFTVPLRSLGSKRITRFSAYADWDREGVVVNTVGADRAPSAGSTALAR